MQVLETVHYSKWLRKLRDLVAKAAIVNHFDAIKNGQEATEDSKDVGGHVTEARFHKGPGYRVYYTRKGDELMLLLVGGDKGSQDRDIAKARELAKEWRENA